MVAARSSQDILELNLHSRVLARGHGVSHSYRLRAEELRAIARDWINDDAQTSLLKVALDYERMAESLDRINACMKEMAASARPN